jgi:hypothetical protein
MSLGSIDHKEPSLDVREFLSLGDEFSPRGGGIGSDPESSSSDGVSSREATISARLLCLSDSLGRCRRRSSVYYVQLANRVLPISWAKSPYYQ